ncbi:hypothetical protein GGI20_000037 [Coemansia sp. BCRC 34301]|nr:hypothetical protein GGI20_000037 [Coemansia sp. BCRC 34301]
MHKVSNPDIKYTVAAQVGEDAQGTKVVDHYVIVRELGHGSFGTVYLVKHAMTGEQFALKEYHKASLRKRLQSTTLSNAPSGRGGGPMRPGRGGGLFAARQRLLQQRSEEDADPFSLIKTELAISKKLQHPHLVRLHEALNDPVQDVLYLVMDLCEHGPVQKIESATSEPLLPEDARRYFTQALLALEYLHEHDIVHRDIKPDNMLLTKDDVLKISDFGESTLHDNNSDKVRGSSGTPAFMAPELCQGATEVSGEAADIWSLGVCLYSFIYGTLPFQGASIIEVLDAVSAGQLHLPDPPPNHEQMNELLTRMLDRDPDTRITIAEIREHPWVTQNGSFALLSKEKNCENRVTAITQADIDDVIKPIFDIMPVIMAVAKLRRFRRRIKEKREREARERDLQLKEEAQDEAALQDTEDQTTS